MGSRSVIPPPPEGFVLDAAPTSSAVPPPPPGFVLDSEQAPAAQPSMLSQVGGAVRAGAMNPVAQTITEAAGRQYVSLPERIEAGFRGEGGVRDIVQSGVRMLPKGVSDAIEQNPILQFAGDVVEEGAKGVGGLVEFMTSPLGVALPAVHRGLKAAQAAEQLARVTGQAGAARTAQAARAAEAAIGGAFGADMAPHTAEAVGQAIDDPSGRNIAAAGVAAGMNVLPAAGGRAVNQRAKAMEARNAAAETSRQVRAEVAETAMRDPVAAMGTREIAAGERAVPIPERAVAPAPKAEAVAPKAEPVSEPSGNPGKLPAPEAPAVAPKTEQVKTEPQRGALSVEEQRELRTRANLADEVPVVASLVETRAQTPMGRPAGQAGVPSPVSGTSGAPAMPRSGLAVTPAPRSNAPVSISTKDPQRRIVEMLVSDIVADPKRFQFKHDAIGKGGTGEEFRNTRTWDPELAGVMSVWRDTADGKTYVVNGHHRLEMAARLGVESVDVRYLKAKTATEARTKGALINIAEGKGSPIDAGKVFRDGGFTPEQLDRMGISLKGKLAADGVALSRLHPSVFDMVAREELSVRHGSIIGDAGLDLHSQKAVVAAISERVNRNQRVSDEGVREMVRRASKAGEHTEQTMTLFGEDVTTRSLLGEESELVADVRRRLGQEKRLFGIVGKQAAADRLGRAGNKLEVEANAQISEQASQALAVFDKLVDSAGPVSDAIQRGAKEIADGKPAARVREQAYESIRTAVSDLLNPRRKGSVRGVDDGGLGGGRGATPPDALTRAETAARERLNSAFKGDTLSANPAALIGDVAIVGAAKMRRGVQKFSDWSREMVAEMGERIKPYLAKAWVEARRLVKEEDGEMRNWTYARVLQTAGKMEDAFRAEGVTFGAGEAQTGTRYFGVDLPGDHRITVRVSDHPQPKVFNEKGESTKVGGFDKGWGDRNTRADISVDPDGLTLNEARAALKEMKDTASAHGPAPEGLKEFAVWEDALIGKLRDVTRKYDVIAEQRRASTAEAQKARLAEQSANNKREADRQTAAFGSLDPSTVTPGATIERLVAGKILRSKVASIRKTKSGNHLVLYEKGGNDLIRKGESWAARIAEPTTRSKAAKFARDLIRDERGTAPIMPGERLEPLPDPKGQGGKPAKVATKAATPDQPGLVASPSLVKTAQKWVDRVGLSDETRASLRKGIDDYIQTHPEMRRVSIEEVKAEARRLDPSLVADLDVAKMKAGETLNPAVRSAAESALNAIQDKVHARTKELREYANRESADPAKIMDMEREVGALEFESKRLLDVLAATRSQDGRNLAYHARMAEKTFDAEYWLHRAKRAAGIPPGREYTIPKPLADAINEATAEGRAAERAATEAVVKGRRSRVGPTPTPERQPVTSEQRIERNVKATLKRIDAKIAEAEGAPPKPPGEWALTPEEKTLVSQDPRVVAARRKLAKILTTAEKTSLLDTITALRRAGLLTGVKTHLRNIGGNTAFQVMEEVSRIPAALVDAALAAGTGRRTTFTADVRAVGKASYAAATRGVREARQVMRDGATAEQLAKLDVRKEINTGNKVIDTYVNTVFRSLGAEDRIFKTYAYERSLAERMKAEKVKEPTQAMILEALNDADFATFNNANPAAQALSRGKSALGPGGRFVVDFLVPFQNTPSNIVARVIEYSGGGAISSTVALARSRSAISKLDPAAQRQISMGYGRSATGLALVYAGYKMAEAGLMTGVSQEDPGQRELNRAAGRLNGAIKVGDTWQTISALAPGGNMLTIGASMWEAANDPKREKKGAGSVALGILGVGTKTVMEQPMLKGMQDAIDALERPDSTMEYVAASAAGSFVPTIVADVTSVFDDKMREARGVTRGVANRLPVTRNQLPPRVDALGRDIPQSKAAAINPGIGSEAIENKKPVVREMVRLRAPLSGLRRREQEPDMAFTERQRLVGRAVATAVKGVMDSAVYPRLSDDERRDAVSMAAGRIKAKITTILGRANYDKLSEAERLRILTSLKESLNR